VATLYISEFIQGVSGIGTTVAQMLPQPSVVDQTVAIGASSAQSAAFNNLTKAVLIRTDAICSIAFGSDPTATAANFRLAPGDPPIPFAVSPGQKVAVITNT
jgi:hypothetical protein